MFINKFSNTTIPQREHARLAGNIAVYWGNNNFDLPTISIHSVVRGISFHQNGYELFDTHPIKQMPERELLQVFRNDFSVKLDDVDADLINMFHQYRLVSGIADRDSSSQFRQLKAEFGESIELTLRESKFNKEDFEWANRITHLCDKISFNFCLGNYDEENVPLYRRVKSHKIINSSHRLINPHTIELNPWPFSVPTIKSIVVSYEKSGYPKKLTPIILEFVLVPNKK